MGAEPMRSDQFILSNGDEVTLYDLTMHERQTCEDAVTHRYSSDGDLIMEGLAKARNLWCAKGLQVDLEDLVTYSGPDLNDIAMEVRRLAGLFADPTVQDG